MTKRALITGITGQDGSHLAELLLDKGYEVLGMVRRTSTVNFERIAHLQDRITFVHGDLLDQVSILTILQEHRPDEVYNLAAQSFVPTSWQQPVLTGEFTALGVTRMLDAIRIVDPDDPLLPGVVERDVRQGASRCPRASRRRSTPARPTAWPRSTATGSRSTTASPTACTPPAASCSTTRARAGASSSSTRKITHGVAQIKLGLADELRLGNLDAQRDWGFAGDYVEAMWLMLQQDDARRLRGRHRRDPLGAGVLRAGVRPRRARLGEPRRASTSSSSARPRSTCSSATPARPASVLGWKPKTTFEDLVHMMVDADLALLEGKLKGIA